MPTGIPVWYKENGKPTIPPPIIVLNIARLASQTVKPALFWVFLFDWSKFSLVSSESSMSISLYCLDCVEFKAALLTECD